MNALDGVVNSLLVSGPQDLGIGTLATASVLSALCASVIAVLFYVRNRPRSDAAAFCISIVLFGLFCCVITLVVGSNIARAFGLVGALSIIRFRNTVKSIEDMMFLFWSLAVGMCIGAGFFTLGAMFTLISIVARALFARDQERINSHLTVALASKDLAPVSTALEKVFRAHSVIYGRDEALSSALLQDRKIRLFYFLKLPARLDYERLLSDLKAIPGLTLDDPHKLDGFQI